MLRLIASGILAIPALLLTVVFIPIQALLSLPACYLLLVRKPAIPKKKAGEKEERHVVVVGGSSGIGLALAEAAAADVTIHRIVLVARHVARLEQAAAQVKTAASKRKNNLDVTIEIQSVDVTDPAAIAAAAATIMAASQNAYTHLFLCVGEAWPQYYQDISPSDQALQVRVNQLGTMYTATAFLKYMTHGTLTFTCSIGGLIGVYGYSAYSPTKFAVRGYAEVLHMELLTSKPNVHVQVAYPPDTDTPGFTRENERKPAETHRISAATALSSAAHIGATMLRKAVHVSPPPYQVYFNLDGFLLCTLCSSFTPVTSVFDAALQVSMMNLTRWIALFYLNDWHRLLWNMLREKKDPAVVPKMTSGTADTPSDEKKQD
jgi:3-dehydrosphinganine reductase